MTVALREICEVVLIFLSICHNLDQKGLEGWSRTSRHFYVLLTPKVYADNKSLRPEQEARFVSTICQRPDLQKHVKWLELDIQECRKSGSLVQAKDLVPGLSKVRKLYYTHDYTEIATMGEEVLENLLSAATLNILRVACRYLPTLLRPKEVQQFSNLRELQLEISGLDEGFQKWIEILPKLQWAQITIHGYCPEEDDDVFITSDQKFCAARSFSVMLPALVPAKSLRGLTIWSLRPIVCPCSMLPSDVSTLPIKTMQIPIEGILGKHLCGHKAASPSLVQTWSVPDSVQALNLLVQECYCQDHKFIDALNQILHTCKQLRVLQVSYEATFGCRQCNQTADEAGEPCLQVMNQMESENWGRMVFDGIRMGVKIYSTCRTSVEPPGYEQRFRILMGDNYGQTDEAWSTVEQLYRGR